jgi:hypothetical protein
MFGLHAVVDFSSDEGLRTHAQSIARRLYDYAARSGFVLKLPDGAETRRGADMRFMSSLLHGVQRATTGDDLWGQAKLANLPNRLRLPGRTVQDAGKRSLTSLWNDDASVDWLGDLVGERIEILVLLRSMLGLGNRDIELKSYALHMIFMATAIDLGIWSPEAQQRVALRGQHHLAVLLNARRSGRLTVALTPADIEAILDACPDSGPSGQNSPESGWAQDNRWIRCTKAYREGSSTDRFNGLDWLILHNLSRL